MAIEVFKGIRRNLARGVITKTETSESWSSVPDGYEVCDVEVIVDMAEIARTFGRKAMANKSGRSRYMGGAVIVNVLTRTRVKD